MNLTLAGRARILYCFTQVCSIGCRLVTNAEQLTGTLQAILFGNAAAGLKAGILDDAYARHLLLDPVCLRINAADCRATTDPYYAVSMPQRAAGLTGKFFSVGVNVDAGSD